MLCALNAAGEDPASPVIRKAVAWLEATQRADGGWGETRRQLLCRAASSTRSTWSPLRRRPRGRCSRSWPRGEVGSDAVRRGVAYLCRADREGAKWLEEDYTAVGFPRVFYLCYHGYSAYFPLWALARYRTLVRSNDHRPRYGM